jgi:hypothetical protein
MLDQMPRPAAIYVEDASEPLLPVSGERPVVLHCDLDAVTEEVGLVLWQRAGSVESS